MGVGIGCWGLGIGRLEEEERDLQQLADQALKMAVFGLVSLSESRLM